MATAVLLQPRQMFERSRDAEFFDPSELQKQTGQPRERFGSVVLKELLDNACDGCEKVPVAPCLTLGVAYPTPDLVALTVEDNGCGLEPETVQRILNFATRSSDKAAYRSPTRGAQGNALKTVFGMPFALGVTAPVILESHGVRHQIGLAIDPAGELLRDYTTSAVLEQPGTRVTLTVPGDALDRDPTYWGQAFALFNPHASVKICRAPAVDLACLPPVATGGDFYQSTVDFPDGWRKYLPGDPTSAWWYSVDDLKRLVFSHISEHRRGGPDRLLRPFVQTFRNLSANRAAQAVCATLPTITRLSDFADQEAAVATLHAAMCQAGKPPSPAILGAVGRAHFHACFERWYGVQRFWYDTKADVHAGIPFIVAVAVAETVDGGELWTGINFSPTFDDPLAQIYLYQDHVNATGITNVFRRAHALPGDLETPATAVAVHLVCPTLEFLDRGKTRLKLSYWMSDLVAKALKTTTKTLYQEGEQRRKNAAKAERQAEARARAAARQIPVTSMKEAVFAVLPEAWRHATGDGQFRVSSRFLFYPVRKLIQELTTKPLDYDYFSQTLLIEYQRQGGQLRGLYYDPRGVLYEPHTGRAVPLGTQEVEAYIFPAWLYDKILYVEKKGVWPILQTARLAERYDMAVVAGEGYATEAIRVLFQAASTDRQYQLFVLHDADPDGYNIARTLREETARMPGYAVDVLDLGLRWEDAMALGLDTEEFTRRRALPEGLVLTEDERRAFEGRRQSHGDSEHSSSICQRVELNACSAPQLVAYIEQRLQDTGVRGKIVPPDPHLTDTARALYRAEVASRVQRAIETLLPIDAITDRLQDHFTTDAPLDQAREWVEHAFTRHRAQWWRDALRSKIDGLLWEQRDAVTDAVRLALLEAIQAGVLSDPEE
jgi:DNA topoisomerase VI subunit B